MTVITKHQHKQDLKNQRDENRQRCTQCSEYNRVDHMVRDEEGKLFCSENCMKDYERKTQ